jgi:hypothetical protein
MRVTHATPLVLGWAVGLCALGLTASAAEEKPGTKLAAPSDWTVSQKLLDRIRQAPEPGPNQLVTLGLTTSRLGAPGRPGPVEVGDVVKTDSRSEGALRSKHYTLALRPESAMTLLAFDAAEFKLTLELGQYHVFRTCKGGPRLSVLTPREGFSADGTAFLLNVAADSTTLVVTEGTVSAFLKSAPGTKVTVGAGYKLTITREMNALPPAAVLQSNADKARLDPVSTVINRFIQDQPRALGPGEAAAIANCLSIVRRCQLPDGAFRLKSNGDPVWIRPYFGNLAALALLASGDATDLARVERWLGWYALNQRRDGTIDDFEGGLTAGYKSNGTRDSVDAYAGTFLLAVYRYFLKSAGKPLPDRVLTAAKNALIAIQSVRDEDGLTWAAKEYRVKFLMDNLETYAGLAAAERLFAALGQPEAETARSMREAMGKKLPSYWREQEGLFAYALHPNGKFDVNPALPNERRRTLGLANLYGLAWVSAADTRPWKLLLKELQPDGGDAPEAPVERWYLAALAAGSPDEVTDYRRKTVDSGRAFTIDNVYIHRAAITALALQEGAGWMPSVRSGN